MPTTPSLGGRPVPSSTAGAGHRAHYLDDRSVAEIAEILGTATGTVKKHLHDGRQAVAHRLRLEEDDG